MSAIYPLIEVYLGTDEVFSDGFESEDSSRWSLAHRKGNDPAEEPSRSRGMGAWLQLCSPRTRLRAWHPLPSRCCNADRLVLECDEGAPSPGGGERVWQRFRPLLRPKARKAQRRTRRPRHAAKLGAADQTDLRGRSSGVSCLRRKYNIITLNCGGVH